MATAGDVARAVLADLNAEAAGILNALRWTHEAYVQVCRIRLRHRRASAELIVPAVQTTGLVTVTQGSNVVTANAAALAVWDQDLVGRYFQIEQVWYCIARMTSTGLELNSTYTEPSKTLNAYRIVARFIELPKDVAFLGAFTHDRRGFELETGTVRELDAVEPRRCYRTSGPTYVADFSESPEGLTLAEVYPYSTQDELIRFVYWTAPPEMFSEDDELPSVITVQDLKEGALVGCQRWWAAKMAAEGKVDMAGFWRNEYRLQEGRWADKVMPNIHRRDRSPEQNHLMLRDLNRSNGPRTIRTARDEVWSRY